MKETSPDATLFSVGDSVPVPGMRRYSHAAMATVFEVFCVHADSAYSAQAAEAVFSLVDRLERELSRFVDNSDVSRISHLSAGEGARISPWTMECLEIARRAYEETAGAFDISIGTGLEGLELVPDEFTVRAHADGVTLDLGGIGKGYAIDRAADLLDEWGVVQALIHGGFSSVRALEPPAGMDGWPLTLSRPGPGPCGVLARIEARQMALSGSGIRKRDHILDPRTGRHVRGRLAVWVSLPCRSPIPQDGAEGGAYRGSPAAVTEALSTAFMILPPDKIGEFCRENPELEVWLVPGPGDHDDAEPGLFHFGGAPPDSENSLQSSETDKGFVS
jgi:FAD:protein FMN transferase